MKRGHALQFARTPPIASGRNIGAKTGPLDACQRLWDFRPKDHTDEMESAICVRELSQVLPLGGPIFCDSTCPHRSEDAASTGHLARLEPSRSRYGRGENSA